MDAFVDMSSLREWGMANGDIAAQSRLHSAASFGL